MKFDITFLLATLLAMANATALPEAEAEALPEAQAGAAREQTFGSCAKSQFGQYRCRPNRGQSTIVRASCYSLPLHYG